ncbi:MAG: hypothetical protein ABI533_10545, partial [Betaproteobacteria bacterium]
MHPARKALAVAFNALVAFGVAAQAPAPAAPAPEGAAPMQKSAIATVPGMPGVVDASNLYSETSSAQISAAA